MVMEVDGGLGQRRPRGCHQKHPRRSPPEKENMVTEKLDGPFSNIVGMKNTWRKTKPVGPWEDIKKRNGNLSRGVRGWWVNMLFISLSLLVGECDIYDA
uniref:Uncharacterized protein n=1 Tax=Oryza rufipogon TaxID=4529 RepID=A0A0E0PUX9_ORYRU